MIPTRTPTRTPLRLVACLVLALVCPALWALQSGPSTGSRSRPAGDGSGVARKTDFGWFRIDPPKEWQAEAVSAGMRKALYRLPAPDKKGATGEMVVFFFGKGQGGNVEANVARWKSQFEKPDGISDEDFAKESRQKADGMPVTIVELRGNYTGARFPGQPAPKVQSDWMMLAAIVKTKGGSYYLRTLGPRVTLEHWKKAWYAMILGMKAGQAQ